MYNKKLEDICHIPINDISDRLAYWVDRVNTITSNIIYNGFNHIINDIEYWFKYDLISQTNMAHARADALTHIQFMILSNDEHRLKICGLKSDGNINIELLPSTDTWVKDWSAYTSDGVKHKLQLSALEILLLAKTADIHVNTIRDLSQIKYIIPLNQCKNNEELDILAMQLHIDQDYLRFTIIGD